MGSGVGMGTSHLGTGQTSVNNPNMNAGQGQYPSSGTGGAFNQNDYASHNSTSTGYGGSNMQSGGATLDPNHHRSVGSNNTHANTGVSSDSPGYADGTNVAGIGAGGGHSHQHHQHQQQHQHSGGLGSGVAELNSQQLLSQAEAKQREAAALQSQSGQIAEAERLEREAMQARERAANHGANPMQGNKSTY